MNLKNALRPKFNLEWEPMLAPTQPIPYPSWSWGVVVGGLGPYPRIEFVCPWGVFTIGWLLP